MLSKQLSEQIIDTLFMQVPEFADIANKRIDQEFIKNGYLVFGPFGAFLSDCIMNEKAEDLINRSYYYINDLCSNPNKEIEELLKVTLFEALVDWKKTIRVSKLKLKDNALLLFEEVLNGPMFAEGIYAT